MSGNGDEEKELHKPRDPKPWGGARAPIAIRDASMPIPRDRVVHGATRIVRGARRELEARLWSFNSRGAN